MLHQLLSQNRDEIINRCERRYRARYPDQPPHDLLTTIPTIIDDLIKAENKEAGLPEESTLPGDSREARVLGEHRFRHGMPIEQIAQDYGAISQVIGELAVEHQISLDARSYQLLNKCIDSAIAQSISTYFELSRERGDREVAEWVGVLGHELRNALSSAVMAYSVVKSGQVGLDSQTARVLERSLNRLESLVAQTLTAVQLRSGTALDVQVIDLGEMLRDVEAAAFKERGIRIDLQVPDEPMIVADPRLLESVLTNLVQNAIKFTHANGRIEIRVRFDMLRAVEIEIEDECGGLVEPTEQLFVPFVQGATGSKQRGVGLGLSITRQAVAAHGGTVQVRNRPGTGCTFVVRLPQP